MKSMIEKYWHPRQYVSNNLQYRIATSSAISRFKMSQTATLKELYNNLDIEFSREAKEVLILKYDVWSQFVYTLEQFLLIERGCSADDIISFCTEIIAHIEEYYNTTLSNVSNIDHSYIDFWILIHHELKELFIKEIEEDAKKILSSKHSSNLLNAILFETVTDKLSQILHYTLYELFTLDILFYHPSQTLRFIYDQVIHDYAIKYDQSLIAKIIQLIYEKHPELMVNRKSISVKAFTSEITDKCYKELKKTSQEYSIKVALE